MITPQQSNAWRGAYLRELRKIAKSQASPWLDDVEWENDKIEDRLAQFVFRDFVTFYKVVEHVFENHPLVIAEIDTSLISKDDLISEGHFFNVLLGVNNYTRDGIISGMINGEELKENMYNALIHNDSRSFLNIISTIDTEEIRRKIGYATFLFDTMRLSIRRMEGDELKEEEESFADNTSKILEARLISQESEQYSSYEELLSTVAMNTHLNLTSFPEEIQTIPQMYYSEVLMWSALSMIADAMFLPPELETVKGVLKAWQFPEITEDLVQLTELIQGYHYTRLFE